MKLNRLLIFCLLFLCFVAFSHTAASAQNRRLTISNLKGSDYAGCGCSLQTLAESKKPNSMKILFWSETDQTAILNINGKDTEFKLVKKGGRPAKEKIGSRFSDVYRGADGITVRIDYRTARVCLPGEESCEVTNYDATITATKGKLKKVLKTRGACGC